MRATRQAPLPGDFSGLDLNADQKRVVAWNEGLLVVSAGPGSGKTRVTTERIIRLIKDGTAPSSILATTFTKKAAGEMNARLKQSGIDTSSMAVQTMHSFCYHLLFDIAPSGLKKGGLESADQKYEKIVKEVVGYQHMKWEGVDLARVLDFIALAKAALLTPEESREKGPLFERPEFDRDTRYSEAYFHAEEMREEKSILTFDDMIVEAVHLLQRDTHTRDLLQTRFAHIIVDEFQDTNRAQLALVEQLARSHRNVMLVGDVDQAIYAFRGAEPTFMMELAEDARSTIISMGINYRCPAPVMEHAVQCIERNSNRITKALVAQKQDEGAVECWEYRDPYEEAWEVVDRIEEVHRDGVPYREIFILYRTHAQSMPFEEELTRREIPYWIKKAGAFYKRKEIRGLLAYLRLLVDPHNAEAGRQALTNPFRYVKRSTLDAIDREVTGGGATYLDAAERVGHVQWNIRITDFVALMRSLRAEDNAGETLDVIVQETDYINKIMEREGSGGWEDSLEVAIDELARSAWRFRTAGAFLQFVEDQIAQASKRSKKKDAVQCMSIHGAKGLEATLVCLVGANKGLLPISKATSAAALEEERRLFYVAITRSKRLLHVSCYVGSEEDRGGASQFIEEAGFEVRPGPKRDE